ncbi:MAG: DUF169 domain-containing protein [Bacteroides sp.]|jgi:uncharacterized protein (DUF169 family)|nr:DUF169 domain-containing protein [Bacteroides sp.]
MISLLKKKYGRLCLGLKVDYHGSETPIRFHDEPLRFCEAVNKAFDRPLLIKPADLRCMGSKRSMGLTMDERALVENIHQESGIDREFIWQAVKDIPRLEKPIENILLGIDSQMEKEIQPDMYIVFLQPAQAMELMKDYALKLKEFAVIKPCIFMSVCGNVFVNTIKSRVLSISFGCPDSRKYAGLTDDLLVAGIPHESCKKLFS